jgi:hypothetical protein
MQTLRLPGHVTVDGRLVIQQPDGLAPGEVEVILVYRDADAPAEGDPSSHPAFGIWSDLPAEHTSAAVAEQLRRALEARSDQRA